MSQLREIAPLLDAYLSYFETQHTPFTIPGHKQKTSRIDQGLGKVVDVDTPMFGGLDEIKLTHGTLKAAEKLAAKLWKADYARFSTGGSTHANQASILALGKPGDKVAISRTAHRSALSAIVLSGLEPVWMYPEIDSATGVPMGISLTEIERALHENPIAVLLTEPGYLGTLSDIEPLIKKAHARNIPVIIDQAWGGHFGFHPKLPKHAIERGADALITSVHKALPGYTASALLLARTKLLDAHTLEQAFETTHTTSPAGAPLASIDGVRALLEVRGEELLGKLLHHIASFKEEVQSHFGEKIFLNPSDFPAGRFDPSKIVIQANVLGLSGVDVENHMIDAGVRVEMADQDTIILLATIADEKEDFEKLSSTLIPILKKLQGKPRPSATSISWSVRPVRGISMRDAYFAKTEIVSQEQAVGRVSVDLIAPYPPGVAVVAPGEILTREIIDGLQAAQDAGIRIAYASDPTLKTYCVVAKE